MADRLPRKDQPPGLLDIVKSTLAAAVGVQSNKNRERDFTHGNIKVYVIAGVIFTLLFLTMVITIVRLVLSRAGS